MYLNYKVFLEIWVGGFIFCITLEKLLVHWFSCNKLLVVFLWSFINSHWAKIPGILVAVVAQSSAWSWWLFTWNQWFCYEKGMWIDFRTACNVFRFSESRLCWLLNTTLDDSRHDQQRDKNVPVLSTTFLLGDHSKGQSCNCRQWSICQGKGIGKEVLAYYLSFNSRAKLRIQEGTFVRLDFIPKMISGI